MAASTADAAHVMRLACAEPQARAVADLMVETFEASDVAASAFESEPDAPRWRSVDWSVEVFFRAAPDEAAVRALIALAADADCAARARFERIAARDWIAASLEGLSEVRAGRFLIHGAHGRGCVRSNDLALEIEAALAFGTGHHGTTLGCLLMLDALLKQRRPRKILDIGTGTGVLAMAAAKALRQRVAAGDIDSVAVEAARKNARLNGVAHLVCPVAARGVMHPALRGGGPYDLIFANILARPLRLLAPAVAGLLAPRGEVILSGLLGPDVGGVLSAYRAQGLFLSRRGDHQGWATLLLRRGGAVPRPSLRA